MTCSYIAIHGGAGNISSSSEKEIKRALKRACTKGLMSLHSHVPATTALADTISILEDDPALNAGYGSNLTLDGTVECDAAIMGGKYQDFGSVGAVSGVKNPIVLAETILQRSRIPDRIGRIPPLTLVSTGAHNFATKHLPKEQLVPPSSLISSRAKDDWEKWMNRLTSEQGPPDGLNDIQDTVGGVAWDMDDNMAAGVSSGGLLLKQPGRIGEAAIFGAGIWVQQFQSGSGIACSISGAGEFIMRANLASALGAALDSADDDDPNIHEILQNLLNKFIDSCRARSDLEPNAGILLMTKEVDDGGTPKARLWCAFTTTTMIIAYASTNHPTPKTLILRQPKHRSDSSIFITAIAM